MATVPIVTLLLFRRRGVHSLRVFAAPSPSVSSLIPSSMPSSFSSLSKPASLRASVSPPFQQRAFTHLIRGGSIPSLHTSSSLALPISSSSLSSTNDDNDKDNNNSNNGPTNPSPKSDIEVAAHHARNIVGPHLNVAQFCPGLSYVDTSALDQQQPNDGGKLHRVIFVLGGPGAGKGTQSERMVSKYGCVHLSVGELLRNEAARTDQGNGEGGGEGELIRKCLVEGKIVPVGVSLGLLKKAMDNACSSNNIDENDENKNGVVGRPIFLVDGFPRNFDNLAGWIDAGMHVNAASTIGVLFYECPVRTLEERILGRAEENAGDASGERRTDDNLESARRRFKTFEGETVPVVDALAMVKGAMSVVRIDATGTVEKVWEKGTKMAMDTFISNDVLTANVRLLRAILTEDALTYNELCPDDWSLRGCEVPLRSRSRHQSDGGKGGTEENAGDGHVATGAWDHEISDAKVEMIDGRNAVVSYDRRIIFHDGEEEEEKLETEITMFRETRVWSHGRRGWMCVHFSRIVLSSSSSSLPVSSPTSIDGIL